MFSRPRAEAVPQPASLPEAGVDEAALIARVAQGDAPAFETLYRAYFPRLARFIERTTRRAELVEEILNDTMFVVSTSAHKFDGSSKLSTWIFAIAWRKSLKALRDVDVPVEADESIESVADEAEPKHEVMRAQLRRVLCEAVDALSPNHRAVIELTYFHEIGYHEIARIMDCPVDTVKTRMFHARRRLKALLPERLEDIL